MSRVLVADDDVQLLEVRANLLEASGHQVAVAFSPSEALRQAAAAEVVVMDLRFLNADGKPDPAEGLKLIRQIRASGCRAPVIVLSGWPQDLEGKLEEGLVSRVMMKPVGIDDLMKAIGEAVAGAA